MKERISGDLSSNELRELGYRLNIQESGYVSADGATIIRLFRKSNHGLVEPYWKGKNEKAHASNLQTLREKGFLVRRNE